MSLNKRAITSLLCAFALMPAYAHDAQEFKEPQTQENPRLIAAAGDQVSGQGEYRFRVLHTRDILPPEAQAVLEKAHGGFAVDRREGKGEIYFSLPGAGIIRISSDLGKAEMIETAPEMKETNMHNATIWFADDGAARLVFPGNDSSKVFTTDLNGKLLGVLNPPEADVDFDQPVVNKYFAGGGRFVPTDVEYLNHFYYITTGYSSLDFVLTAQVDDSPFANKWYDLAFGGKGDQPGMFQTGHGITVTPDGNHIDVADRPVAEIDHFTRYGHYRGTTKLPEGSFPCDIDFTAGYSLVPCLHGPDREKGAPIYLMKGEEVLSTVMIKEELGMEKFQHIHNAVLVKRGEKLYIIAQAWNPGDFAVLEQVMD